MQSMSPPLGSHSPGGRPLKAVRGASGDVMPRPWLFTRIAVQVQVGNGGLNAVTNCRLILILLPLDVTETEHLERGIGRWAAIELDVCHASRCDHSV